MRPFVKSILNLALSIAIFVGIVWFCRMQADTIGVTSAGFALTLNLVFMGYFALLIGLYNPAMTHRYFDARVFEQNGRIYRRLGVLYFIWFLRIVGSERHRRQTRPLKKRLDTLLDYEKQTRISEASHALAFLLVGLFTLYVFWTEAPQAILWLLVFNVLLNGYPVMLQRHNRPRLQRIIRRFEGLAQENDT